MNQPRLVCLSLTPNLRCIGFTLGQFSALIIPPAVEVVVSLIFIFLYSRPGRRAQLLLALDSSLYLIWALLDTLSHVVPAARNSFSFSKVVDFLVGAASFTPIFVYPIYLYRLSFCYFIPSLPRKLQPYLELLLPVLLVMAVAINEVSSFLGTHLGTSSNQTVVVTYSQNNDFLWLSLNHSSLIVFAVLQFLFFLLAFCRLSRAFLDQRRIELAHSDQCHYFRGIAWITAGIIVGVIETITGFAQATFEITLARRILRLISRAMLMFGLLKGSLDVGDNCENFADEARGASRIRKCISCVLGINLHRIHMFHRMSQTHTDQSQADYSSAEKQPREQRVTVRYEKGQAPFLQIRFSTLDFPAQPMSADMVQLQQLSGSNPGPKQQRRMSDEMATNQNTMYEARRQRRKSAPAAGNEHPVLPDWMAPPVMGHIRRGSGGSVSDSLSIVRDVEQKFPDLPPRVTLKRGGSVRNYEENDPFPVVGVTRQPSMRQAGGNPNEEVTLHPTNSIRRKPAPPLLENISDQRNRPPSTWGGLRVNTANPSVDFPVGPSSPESALAREPNTPRSRRATARNFIQRASRALSDASVRSAEWLASAMSSQPASTPLTTADIERYRRGDMGPGPARLVPSSGDNLSKDHVGGRGANDAYAYAY